MAVVMNLLSRASSRQREAQQGTRSITWSYENEVPFEKRSRDCSKILEKYPERLPLICEKLPTARASSSSLPQIAKKKFLVPRQMTISQFLWVLKQQLEAGQTAKEEKAIYVTLRDRTSPAASAPLKDIYSKHKSEDGFLYVHYSTEAVFG